MPPTTRNTLSDAEKAEQKAQEAREIEEFTELIDEILRCIQQAKTRKPPSAGK